jgi:hypothetical protein
MRIGSFFVFNDTDGDGVVTDASELVGVATGDAFSELRELDSDGNGWIDEADAAFSTLGLWSPTSGTADTLAEAGVGDLSTSSVAAPFTLRDPSGDAVAEQVAAGVFLAESGQAGLLRQIDLLA